LVGRGRKRPSVVGGEEGWGKWSIKEYVSQCQRREKGGWRLGREDLEYFPTVSLGVG